MQEGSRIGKEEQATGTDNRIGDETRRDSKTIGGDNHEGQRKIGKVRMWREKETEKEKETRNGGR